MITIHLLPEFHLQKGGYHIRFSYTTDNDSTMKWMTYIGTDIIENTGVVIEPPDIKEKVIEFLNEYYQIPVTSRNDIKESLKIHNTIQIES